jgi:hypothetical protein
VDLGTQSDFHRGQRLSLLNATAADISGGMSGLQGVHMYRVVCWCCLPWEGVKDQECSGE